MAGEKRGRLPLPQRGEGRGEGAIRRRPLRGRGRGRGRRSRSRSPPRVRPEPVEGRSRRPRAAHRAFGQLVPASTPSVELLPLGVIQQSQNPQLGTSQPPVQVQVANTLPSGAKSPVCDSSHCKPMPGFAQKHPTVASRRPTTSQVSLWARAHVSVSARVGRTGPATREVSDTIVKQVATGAAVASRNGGREPAGVPREDSSGVGVEVVGGVAGRGRGRVRGRRSDARSKSRSPPPFAPSPVDRARVAIGRYSR